MSGDPPICGYCGQYHFPNISEAMCRDRHNRPMVAPPSIYTPLPTGTRRTCERHGVDYWPETGGSCRWCNENIEFDRGRNDPARERQARIDATALAIFAASFAHESLALRQAYVSEPYVTYLAEDCAAAYRFAHALEAARAAAGDGKEREGG